MNSEDLSKRVLDTIKKDKIKPRPRWEFLLKDYFIWALFVLSVFIGSIAVSVLTFVIKNEALLRFGPANDLKNILAIVPYFWLLTLLAFLFLAYLNFKHTKTGYRYNILKVFVLSIIASLVLGSVFYYFGISAKVESITYDRIPIYKNMMEHRANMLISPEEGHLGGMIIENDNTNIKIRAFDGKVWDVDLNKINLSAMPILESGLRIRIIGKKTGQSSFEAEQLMPWMDNNKPRRGMLNYLNERNNPNMRIIKQEDIQRIN